MRVAHRCLKPPVGGSSIQTHSFKICCPQFIKYPLVMNNAKFLCYLDAPIVPYSIYRSTAALGIGLPSRVCPCATWGTTLPNNRSKRSSCSADNGVGWWSRSARPCLASRTLRSPHCCLCPPSFQFCSWHLQMAKRTINQIGQQALWKQRGRCPFATGPDRPRCTETQPQ